MFANIRQLISSRNEDFTFYVQCNCGNEIIQFYYYEATAIDDEIIGIKYFGHLDDIKDSRCANFMFTRESFQKFIEATSNALNLNVVHGNIVDDLTQEYLVFNKDKYGFYTLLKARSKSALLKKKYVWDIALTEIEVNGIYEKLIEMKNKMEEKC